MPAAEARRDIGILREIFEEKSSAEVIGKRRIPAEPLPIHTREPDNMLDVINAAQTNLAIVSGGYFRLEYEKIALANPSHPLRGIIFYTDGLIGQFIREINPRIQELEQRTQALIDSEPRDGRKRFWLRTSTQAIQDLEAEKKRTQKAYKDATDLLKEQIRAKKRNLDKFCKLNDITTADKDTFEGYIAEEHRIHVEPTIIPFRPIGAQGPLYRGYKRLALGYEDSDGKYIKGLRDLEQELEVTDTGFKTELIQNATEREKAQERAKKWEDEAKKLGFRKGTSRELVKASNMVIRFIEIEDELHRRYVLSPDEIDELQQMQEALITYNNQLNKLKEEGEPAANSLGRLLEVETLGSKGIKRSNAIKEFVKKSELDLQETREQKWAEFDELTSDKRRFPRMLYGIYERLTSRGFDPITATAEEKITWALSGKGEYRVDEVKPVADTYGPERGTPEEAGREQSKIVVAVRELLGGSVSLKQIEEQIKEGSLKMDSKAEEILADFFEGINLINKERKRLDKGPLNIKEMLQGIAGANFLSYIKVIPDLIIVALRKYYELVNDPADLSKPDPSTASSIGALRKEFKVKFLENKTAYKGPLTPEQVKLAEHYLLFARIMGHKYYGISN